MGGTERAGGITGERTGGRGESYGCSLVNDKHFPSFALHPTVCMCFFCVCVLLVFFIVSRVLKASAEIARPGKLLLARAYRYCLSAPSPLPPALPDTVSPLLRYPVPPATPTSHRSSLESCCWCCCCNSKNNRYYCH